MNHTYNTVKVKKMNKELVRNAIKEMSGGTKAMIAAKTGLSQATCNTFLNELAESGEVFTSDEELTNGGRPAQLFRYNADFAKIACIYIENDNKQPVIRFAIMNLLGNIIEEEKVSKTYIEYKTIEELVEHLVDRCQDIKVIGIGVPGIVLEQRSTYLCDIKSLNDCPLAEQLEQRFGINVIVENDMNAAINGIYQKMKSKEEMSMVVMTFMKDNLPGSGIILNGQIVRGKSHFAGEIAYLPYGLSMEQLEDNFTDSSRALPFIIDSIRTYIAVLNPDKVILNGSLLSEEMMPEIQTKCNEYFPYEHMPDIIFLENIHSEYLLGLMSIALKKL